jgi:hypothetical protein
MDGAADSVTPVIDALEERDCDWAVEREDGGNSSLRAQEDREMVNKSRTSRRVRLSAQRNYIAIVRPCMVHLRAHFSAESSPMT